jgi:hypothetical protein
MQAKHGIQPARAHFSAVFDALRLSKLWLSLARLYERACSEPQLQMPSTLADPTHVPASAELLALDLHGHSLSEAVAAILHHLLQCVRRLASSSQMPSHGLELILGKGLHSPDGEAVIREQLPTWLRDELGLHAEVRADNAGRFTISRQQLDECLRQFLAVV